MSDGPPFLGAVPGGAYEKWLEAKQRQQASAEPEDEPREVRFFVGSGDPQEYLARLDAREQLEREQDESTDEPESD